MTHTQLKKSTALIRGKTILLRVAYDVPVRQRGKRWVVADERRILETIPTIKFLLRQKCKIVLLSWLGRPNGVAAEQYRMDSVAVVLRKLLDQPISKLDACIGPVVQKHIAAMRPGDITLLENVRFYPEEHEQDHHFARALVEGIDVIVFDAFAQAHRTCPSVTGIAALRPTIAGLLLERELAALTPLLERPRAPFVIIIGGAKISDKVGLLRQLAPRADAILLGGGPANVFLQAAGVPIGQSYVEANMPGAVENDDYGIVAQRLLKRYRHKWILPVDMIAADMQGKSKRRIDLVASEKITADERFLDIGPKTIALFKEHIRRAKTILWNGPLGMFEQAAFAAGTCHIAQAVAENPATTIIGGGDTETVVARYHLDGKFSHVSTGGGATLEFLAHGTLPVFKYLKK